MKRGTGEPCGAACAAGRLSSWTEVAAVPDGPWLDRDKRPVTGFGLHEFSELSMDCARHRQDFAALRSALPEPHAERTRFGDPVGLDQAEQVLKLGGERAVTHGLSRGSADWAACAE